MPVKILTIQDIGREKWDTFVRSHPDGSFYHLSAWHRTIEESYGYQTRYYLVENSAGGIRSAVPVVNLRNIFLGRRTVCYPFSDYCDPLLGRPEDLGSIADRIIETDGNLEIRTRNISRDIEGLHVDSSFSNYTINLEDDPGIIYSRMHKSCIRRKIKKAEREGVEIREGNSVQDLKSFYRLHLMTRKRLGLPAQPFGFFRKLRENFAPSGNMKMLFAEYRGRKIGSLLLLGFRAAGESARCDTLYYKYGASDGKYFYLGSNPALFWKAITLAGEHGYSILDLGRASDTDEKTLGEFKLHLGAEKKALIYYSTLKAFSESAKSGGAALAGKVFRLTPLWISGMAGRLFYRYLG